MSVGLLNHDLSIGSLFLPARSRVGNLLCRSAVAQGSGQITLEIGDIPNMRKFLVVSAALAGLTIVPSLALAAEVVVEPEVETWVMDQSVPGVDVEGDVVVGGTLPETVELMEVPKFQKYRFAVVNKHRVIVDAKTRKIVKVYK